jgi:hypothetical protein
MKEKVDCYKCDELTIEVPWGPYTKPPLGFCHAKIMYVWKRERHCTKYEPDVDAPRSSEQKVNEDV